VSDFKRTQIQEAIVGMVKDREFRTVAYDTDGVPRVRETEFSIKAARPILCNEVNSSFEVDPDHGRYRVLRRRTWNFALKMKFPSEVLLEEFESELQERPPHIAGLNTTIFLLSANVEHPVQQDGKTGTIAEYVFQALEGRK